MKKKQHPKNQTLRSLKKGLWAMTNSGSLRGIRLEGLSRGDRAEDANVKCV
jgi:hypothetical protein